MDVLFFLNRKTNILRMLDFLGTLLSVKIFLVSQSLVVVIVYNKLFMREIEDILK